MWEEPPRRDISRTPIWLPMGHPESDVHHPEFEASDRDLSHDEDQTEDTSSEFELADQIISDMIRLREETFGLKKVDSRHDASLLVARMKELASKFHKQARDLFASDIDPFVRMIEAAGPRAAEWLECFSIEVDAQAFQKTIAHRRFQLEGTPTKMQLGPLQLCKEPQNSKDFWQKLAPEKPPRSVFNFFELPLDKKKLLEFDFHWIFFEPLLCSLGPYEVLGRDSPPSFIHRLELISEETSQPLITEEQMVLARMRRLLGSFLKVDNTQHVFETVPARALLCRTQKAVQSQFWAHMVISSVSLLGFVFVAYSWNVNPNSYDQFHGKVRICAFILMFGSGFELLVHAIDLVAFWCHCEMSDWFTLWTGIDIISELVTFEMARCWVLRKNMIAGMLPATILSRWLKFVLLLFQLDWIGLWTVPVMVAVFSAQSISVLLLTLTVSIGASHAYLGFEVYENDKTYASYGRWGIFTAFMRMSRVIMFTDGDLDELAGRKEAVSADATIDGEDEGSWGKIGTFEGSIESINCFTLVLLMIGVVLMNVYVGVLSDKYNEYNGHRFHYFHQWRVQWQMRALLRRCLWSSKHCPSRLHCFAQLDPVASYQDPREKDQGLWIVSEPMPGSGDEIAASLQEVRAANKDILAKLNSIQNKDHPRGNLTPLDVTAWTVQQLKDDIERIRGIEMDCHLETLAFQYTNALSLNDITARGFQALDADHGWIFSRHAPVDCFLNPEGDHRPFQDVFHDFYQYNMREYGRPHYGDYVILVRIPTMIIKDVGNNEVFVHKIVYEGGEFPASKILRIYQLAPVV